MRLPWFMAALFMLPLLLVGTPRAQAQGYDSYGAEGYAAYGGERNVDDVSVFYDTMAPYGDWHYTPEYGYVWIPYEAYNDWRPYMNAGHWAWTDYGWMWVSDYDWGWAAFHYGRWIMVDNLWAWVPDVVWGPAWVAWRYTDDYVGWAPLAPGAYWYPDYGLDVTITLPYSYWTFVPGPRILDVHVYRYAVPRGHTNRIYYGSRPATVYRVSRGAPVCVGVDVRVVTRWTGAPVRQVNVTISGSPGRSVYRGGSVTIYRPTAYVTSRRAAPPSPRRSAPSSLYRVSAPPPPSRAGVAPSQQYHQRAAYQQKAYAPPPTSGSQRYQRSPEMQQQRRETGREHQELKQDRRDLQQDKREYRQDIRTQPYNSERTREDREDVQRSRQELNEQRRETGREHRETQQERQERRERNR